MAFDLASIQTGKNLRPPRVCIYGQGGLGKSTFCANAPKPIFIPTEEGLDAIGPARFPVAESFEDIQSALSTLATSEHEFQTLVLDTIDWLEPLLWRHTASKHEQKDIESFGYGKGFAYAADELRNFLSHLDWLRDKRGMAILLVGHAHTKRYDDPTSDPYDRYSLKLHKTSADIVMEWCDVVGFASQPHAVVKTDVGFKKQVARGKALGDENVINLQRTPAYDAKNRYGLPNELPLEWGAFSEALTQTQEATNG